MVEKHEFKSIRYRTIMRLALLFIFLVLTIYSVLNTVMLSNIKLLENRYISEHINRVENTMNSELIELTQIAYDWAVWDDTYEFVNNKNKTYVEKNLPKNTFSNLRIDVLAFIDVSGEYIFSGELNGNNGNILPISNNLMEYIKKSPIIKNTDPNYKISGVVLLPEGPMLLATSPILLSSGDGPVHGNLIVGRYINSLEINLLRNRLNLQLEVEQLDKLTKEKAQIFNSITSKSPIIVHQLNNNKIGGYSILNDIYGQPALGISIVLDKEISILGQKGILYVLILLIFVSFAFTIAMLIFLEKNILSRLSGLSKEIRLIGSKGILSMRLKPEKIRDEIAILSEEINSMLDDLEKSQIKIVDNEEALKKINEDLETRVYERTIELSKANESLKNEIIEREKIQQEIKHLAYHDYLTGLPNRLYFIDLLNHSISLSSRMNRMVTIMFLDLDSFKIINDTMGHGIGDQLLKEVSKRLVNTLRKCDIVARLGGDEFIIMFENIENIESIKLIAEKILKAFNRPFILNSQECFISTSIGIAVYPMDGENAEMLIKNADIAMYKAKEKGKNQYVFCTSAMKANVIETMELSNSLYRALERNELELYYQPQVSCNSHKIVGLEALLRWNHPELGMISPGKFIPIAEQTGLITPIGTWVIRTACKQNKLWQDAGLPKVRMAVNLSVNQFQNPDIVKDVKGILNEFGLSSQYFELEITENVVMKEKDYIIETLESFKNLGITISIDDFGTEYSSLQYLKQLPIDRIKIAMPFVQGIDVSDKDKAIAKAIIVLGKSIGLGIIAEGVETKNQLTFLTKRMCDEIQGFYYYKPMPANEVEELLRKTT